MKIYKPIIKKINSFFLVRVFFREIPKIMNAQGRTAFQLQDEIISIGISHELAYLLGFLNHPKHGITFITMNNSSKHALPSTHQRPLTNPKWNSNISLNGKTS